ncbi:MAG: hypothetical protein LBC19_04110 [Tannerella sp.]|nr:hypothetical protein [Tannerella sp.]
MFNLHEAIAGQLFYGIFPAILPDIKNPLRRTGTSILLNVPAYPATYRSYPYPVAPVIET